MSQGGQLAPPSQLRNVEVAVSESRDSVSGWVSNMPTTEFWDSQILPRSLPLGEACLQRKKGMKQEAERRNDKS